MKKMKLHLIRHAKTDPSSDSGKDFDRKLLPKGVIQANVLGNYFKEQSVSFSNTYCSSAVRTKETLTIIQEITELGNIHLLDELYLTDKEVYLKIIWELKHQKDILFIGHNDGISEFASYLVEKEIHMKTCTYLCIEFKADSWVEVSKGTGELLTNFRPSFHFPD